MSDIKNVDYGLEKIFEGAQDFLPLLGTDYVELYVGNAKQAAHFYKTAFGFQSLAYRGLETGCEDSVSYVLVQDKIRLVLTTPLHSKSPINDHIVKHGDGVKVIALWVDDARKAYEETTSRGAKSYMEPTVEKDEHGEVVRAGIHTYGETIHMFVERKNYNGTFYPGFIEWKSDYNPESMGLKFIDHMVGNVGWGEMDTWVKWYEDIMGFENFLSFDDKQIHTEYSALMSKVMSNGNGRIKFPINEPAKGKKKSQIEEYLDFYEGPGVQHIAVATNDIIKTVSQMRANGVEFLSTPPDEYYRAVPERLTAHNHKLAEDIEKLKSLGIMIDADEEGYLLQIFTKPVEDRPTMFFEIIQRMGARGFGAGNFKALFESIEREQEKERDFIMAKTATIVGAGLVGSLWAVYLSKAGYQVKIFESRDDLRKADISAGKSINLALSVRGWKAFENVGVEKEIKEIAIPMYGRTMHDMEGKLTYQPYGQDGQAIYSVSRAGINCKMMDIAEKHGGAEIYYNLRCYDADLDNGIVYLENTITGEKQEVKSDVVFASDGAFSAVRYNAMQKLPRFDYSQKYIEDGYREILLPANEDGSYKMDINTLHIWPRGRFMLIALANEDGSFTCTLFMPFDNHEYAFDKLNDKKDVDNFFKNVFPDFYEMMPNIGDAWEDHPLSALAITRCYPWHAGKFALMGDAAHATVPFYGQGMNAGFEDCTVMWELMNKHDENWDKVFEEYSVERKPNGDALQDLSLHNYHVMRDFVSDPDFLLQKNFERRIEQLYPNKYLALYSQVSFSHIPYSEAYKRGMEQDKLIKDIMSKNDVKQLMADDNIDQLIHSIFDKISV